MIGYIDSTKFFNDNDYDKDLVGFIGGNIKNIRVKKQKDDKFNVYIYFESKYVIISCKCIPNSVEMKQPVTSIIVSEIGKFLIKTLADSEKETDILNCIFYCPYVMSHGFTISINSIYEFGLK